MKTTTIFLLQSELLAAYKAAAYLSGIIIVGMRWDVHTEQYILELKHDYSHTLYYYGYIVAVGK